MAAFRGPVATKIAGLDKHTIEGPAGVETSLQNIVMLEVMVTEERTQQRDMHERKVAVNIDSKTIAVKIMGNKTLARQVRWNVCSMCIMACVSRLVACRQRPSRWGSPATVRRVYKDFSRFAGVQTSHEDVCLGAPP